MKILLGVPEYPPHHIGGGGIVYKKLAQTYKELGHEVVVIYGYYKNQKFLSKIEEKTEGGIKFYQVPEIPYPKGLPFLRTVMPPTLNTWTSIKDINKTEKPDVAHLHGYGWPFTNIVASACNSLQIPYVYTIHGYPESQSKSILPIRLVWSLFIKYSQNRNLRKARKVTAVSKFIANDERNIAQDKTEVVYNGMDFEAFRKIENEISIRKKHNISEDILLIFSLGRISKMKGFQDVVKLLPEIKPQGKKVKYIIAGDDDGYKPELEALIKELYLEYDVIFTGFLDDNTKKMYINQCDIYAVPSLWEPFGMVVLEGMAFDKTILTTEAGGIKEILEEYPNKIRLDDPDVIEKVINTNPQPYTIDERRFSWDSIAKQYLNLMDTPNKHG